jgi:hypothetical protein
VDCHSISERGQRYRRSLRFTGTAVRILRNPAHITLDDDARVEVRGIAWERAREIVMFATPDGGGWSRVFYQKQVDPADGRVCRMAMSRRCNRSRSPGHRCRVACSPMVGNVDQPSQQAVEGGLPLVDGGSLVVVEWCVS